MKGWLLSNRDQNSRGPLAGVRVLDFSTLLPGPLATLLLSEAGATVVKVERPPDGDDMRSYTPAFGSASAAFALLNRGKTSIALDLKSPQGLDKLRPLLDTADVLVEQFRPGVMRRLGLGYEQLMGRNPGLVYCSITGYGQEGPRAQQAAHDLNYVADSGMLHLTSDSTNPVLPPALVADVGGGAYPAVMNILLALHQRRQGGRGAYLDIAMADNVFPFMYYAFAQAQTGEPLAPGHDAMSGGSARYQMYRTRDDRTVAAAPLEQKFWNNFCDVLDLDTGLRDDSLDPAATRAAVASLIAARPSGYWRTAFAGVDCCCTVAATVSEALTDPAFASRGQFTRKIEGPPGAPTLTALPVPLAPELQSSPVSIPFQDHLDMAGDGQELSWPSPFA